ncbi:unnamed protein product, partial [Ranitomeya imitator]
LDGRRSGKRKRRGGKRHRRKQKEIREEQSPKTTEPEEKRTELVINISQKVLSDMEISVLSKGLSFSPCSHMDWFQLQLDLGQFFRRLKLKEWFSDKEATSKERVSELDLKTVGLIKESNFAPATSSSVIEAFERAVLMDIEGLRDNAHKEFRHPNILKEEFVALQGLVHDNDIVIKPADKGGAVVVLDKSMYIGEIMRQLQDENVYVRMEGDPKYNINREIKMVLKQAVEGCIIDQDLHDYLLVEHPRTPVLYITPKIHKTLNNPPGCPIISGVKSIFNKMGIFLDKIFNPIVKIGKSYIKDTTDFLNKLEGVKLDQAVILASFDVVSLYTSIDHERGLEEVGKKLNGAKYTEESRMFILQLLEIILKRNYFLFGDVFYAQKRGTAMGANMAPSYANLVMKILEEEHIYPSCHFQHVLVWWRYVDDVFLLRTGTQIALENFLGYLFLSFVLLEALRRKGYLNTIDLTIKFTRVSSKIELQFLDVLIRQREYGLDTTLFVKSTDRNNLLTYDSQHPRRMVRSIPLGQLLRVRRVVQNEEEELLLDTKEKVLRLERSDLIRNKTNISKRKYPERIPIVTTYVEESRDVANIIKKHWGMLGKCLPNVKEFKMPPLFSYRKNRNIKDYLVKSDIGPIKKNIQHPETNKVYQIKHYLTCNSDYVIYLLMCPCNLWYIGETICAFKVRMNQHRCTIRKKRMDLPVPKHFTEHNHTEKELKFKIIDAVPPPKERGGDRDREQMLKKKELMWIYELNTLKPKGLNVDFSIHGIT